MPTLFRAGEKRRDGKGQEDVCQGASEGKIGEQAPARFHRVPRGHPRASRSPSRISLATFRPFCQCVCPVIMPLTLCKRKTNGTHSGRIYGARRMNRSRLFPQVIVINRLFVFAINCRILNNLFLMKRVYNFF